ncbi:unnamed protein product [Arctia plantaginis]|uniref:Uncharacterized protein n=1 Tax=Arctia plantaginis TaxID=874455 RepID=A0A8S0YRP5_ARCPL|nr:unnamed protein product [Arctia plantaginis]
MSKNFPGFVILPALIVSPVLKNKQNGDKSININEKLIVVNVTELTLNNNTQEDDRDFDANFREALDRGNSIKKHLKQIKLNETFSIIADVNNNGTSEKEEVTTLETTSDPNITGNMTTELYTTTEIQGFYSNSRYNNTDINSLAITVKSPDSSLQPPLTKEEWFFFAMNTNISIAKDNKTEPNLLNITGFPSENKPNSQTKGVYKAALYNNAEIDQLSITTNFYTNELALPPPQDDRWSNFSSLKKRLPPLTEFKPLAGLYYDGFLHKPVIKSPGFVPYNQFYFY